MGFFDKIKKIGIFNGFSKLTDEFYDELEESLILADMGMDTTMKAVDELRRRLARAEQEGYAAVAIDGYALFESGCDKLCDTTVGVLAPAEIRVRRIMDREGISEDYARARVAAQRDDDFYRQRCGHILMNDCASPEEFGQRARAFFQSVI
mgnify:CR=1 FL=1